MVRKNKFKLNTLLRENIISSSKILKFKKKKWAYQKRILKNDKKIQLQQGEESRVFKKNFLRHYYRNFLNLKRKLRVFYGPLKYRRLRFMLRKCGFHSIVDKKTLLETSIIRKNSYYKKRISYFIDFFESFVSIILFRAGFFSTQARCFHAIYQGLIKVNGNIIYNPWVTLRVGDVITSVERNIYLSNTRTRVYNPTHLIINLRKYKIVYSKKPNLSELEYPSNFDWKFLRYISKLKRL